MNDNLINNLEYTVSELSNSIKRIIEDNFDYIRIKAEIGRVSKPNSGHIYLDLKDDASVISGIVWKGNVNKLDINILSNCNKYGIYYNDFSFAVNSFLMFFYLGYFVFIWS